MCSSISKFRVEHIHEMYLNNAATSAGGAFLGVEPIHGM